MRLKEIRTERGLSVPKLVELSRAEQSRKLKTVMTAAYQPPSSWLMLWALPWMTYAETSRLNKPAFFIAKGTHFATGAILERILL